MNANTIIAMLQLQIAQLVAACEVADEALCAATWVNSTDTRALKYASLKCRAAIANTKKAIPEGIS
jgi:hypothetical protein